MAKLFPGDAVDRFHRDAPTSYMVEGSSNICKWIITPDQPGDRKANRYQFD